MVPAEKDELTRKRVLYIGSAVPLNTAEGLEAVQGPLSERYPVDDDSNIEGILSTLSVLPSGITLQYISDPSRILFFPITSLTICAAVRCVSMVNAATGERTSQFVSLSSPAAGGPANCKRPAIFTAITRRTEGRKVLECHGFICSSSKDALELVQCTSFADRSRKGKVHNTTLPAAGSSFRLEPSSTLPSSSFFSTTTPRNMHMNAARSGASPGSPPVSGPDGDPPVRLVAGERPAGEVLTEQQHHQQQHVAPEFYEPPPEHGYFYKTRDSQIKTYTVERVMEGEGERLRAVHPPPPGVATTLPRPHPGDRRPGPPLLVGGGASVVGGPGAAMTLPHPPSGGRTVIPVRALHHPPGSATTTLIRPRFFSPPPPMLRPRPLTVTPGHVIARDPYVFLPPPPHPPPPHFIDLPPYGGGRGGGRRRHPRRGGGGGSDSSSRGSSSSSSPSYTSPHGSPRQMNGRGGGGRMNGGDGGEGASSDVSSRPRSPPTDYDRGARASRKDQFHRHQRHLLEMNGHHHHYSTLPGGPAPQPLPPHLHPHHPGYDLYLYPPQHQHHRYPPYPTAYPPSYGIPMERARSMPPPLHRGKSKDRGKKGRKSGGGGKKEKKKKKPGNKHRGYGGAGGEGGGGGGAPSDISTDSVGGYTSEVGPAAVAGGGGENPPRMPRDFRRLENQFKHERAFSKSLAEEFRGGPGEGSGNAYSLNDHMAQRGMGADGDFNLY